MSGKRNDSGTSGEVARRNDEAIQPRFERLNLEREYHLLLRLVAMAGMQRADSVFYTDERFIDWLDRELQSKYRAGEGWSRAKIASVARRMEAKVESVRLRVACASGHPASEPTPVSGTVAQLRELAVHDGAAPDLELAAAAGVGLELWDEPCERWIRLPREMPRGEYLALRVSGDSMIPLFHPGDTVLVKLGAEVSPETVVVARVPDDGYVIKRVARVSATSIELASLNPDYAPVRIQRRRDTVLGRVVLRWCPHEAPPAQPSRR